MNMSALANKTCIPCRGGIPSISPEEQIKLLSQLEGWTIIDHHHLTKTYKFSSFKNAQDWITRLANCTEEQGHHPVIFWNFREVRVDIWTHKIDGLVESDFILAAKADGL